MVIGSSQGDRAKVPKRQAELVNLSAMRLLGRGFLDTRPFKYAGDVATSDRGYLPNRERIATERTETTCLKRFNRYSLLKVVPVYTCKSDSSPPTLKVSRLERQREVKQMNVAAITGPKASSYLLKLSGMRFCLRPTEAAKERLV